MCQKNQIITAHSCRSSISGCTQNSALFSHRALQTLRVTMNPSQGLKAPTLHMVRVGIIIELVAKLLHEPALQFIYPTCKKPYGSYFFQDKNWILTLQIWAIDSDVEAGTQRERERERATLWNTSTMLLDSFLLVQSATTPSRMIQQQCQNFHKGSGYFWLTPKCIQPPY